MGIHVSTGELFHPLIHRKTKTWSRIPDVNPDEDCDYVLEDPMVPCIEWSQAGSGRVRSRDTKNKAEHPDCRQLELVTHTECKVRILDQFYLQRTDSVYPLIVVHKKRRWSIKLLQLPAIYARKVRWANTINISVPLGNLSFCNMQAPDSIDTDFLKGWNWQSRF